MEHKNSRLLGSWGESRAAEMLRGKGFTILAMNYTTRFGEIDIIAEDRRYIVFAEVKLRRGKSFMEARESVNAAKQQRILISAQQWLSEHKTEKQPRIDVIEIYAPEGIQTPQPQIIHTENAFYE